MGSKWFIQFNDYHVYYRISGCMIKKTATSRILLLCLHTHCKCFEETAQITIPSELHQAIGGCTYATVFSSKKWRTLEDESHQREKFAR